MDHSFGMRHFQRAANLLGHMNRIFRSELPFPFQNGAQVLAIHVLHRDELDSVGFAQVENAHDVAVGHIARQDEFLLEALQNGRISRQFRTDDF